MELLTLAGSAFLAATLLPGGSEVYLLYLDHNSEHADWLLVLAASIGNTAGSMTSWVIGRLIPAGKKLEQKHARALAWMRQYGVAALLLSWVPIIGDPLCVVAGWFRIPFALALAVIAVAKTLRYAVLVAFV